MKKEIDVWIHDGFDENIEWRAMQVAQKPGSNAFNTKAKLIIDISRKKMLTEDEVRDALNDRPDRYYIYTDEVIEKLFGEDTDAN